MIERREAMLLGIREGVVGLDATGNVNLVNAEAARMLAYPMDDFLGYKQYTAAAVVHVLAFWVLVQVADVVLPYVGVVDEPVRWAIVAGVGLFPVTLIAAWFYEHPWTRLTRGRVATDIILIALIACSPARWFRRSTACS